MARPTKQAVRERQIKSVPRRELYPTSEACILLCCSWGFLADLIKAGKIKYVLRNRNRFISQEAIAEYIRKEERLCEIG